MWTTRVQTAIILLRFAIIIFDYNYSYSIQAYFCTPRFLMIALPKRPSLNDCTALAVAIELHLVVMINRSTYTYNVTINPGLCYYTYIYIFLLFLLLSRYPMKDGIFDRTA